MDIYDYLKMDHKKVAHLFKQFEDSQSPLRKHEIADMIAQELTVHADAEQQVFYAYLEKFNESKEEALHGEKEHQEIKDQITLILKATKYDAAWSKKVLKLKEMVEHHVKDEEGPMFKKAKEVISQEEANILKERVHILKGNMLLKYKNNA